MSRAKWLLDQLTSMLWLRALAFSGVGIAAALLAFTVRDYIPEGLDTKIGADSVSRILGILASSMLAVTTFSLGIMVSAFSSAASNATPRTTQLLRADSVAQNVLSIFIGAFLYSIVGIIALQAGIYGSNGRSILFVLTIAVILVVVAALLRWIDHLSRFGLLSDTVQLVEAAAARSIGERLAAPYFGAERHPGALPSGPMTPVRVGEIGYIQNVDLPRLSELADDHKMAVYVDAVPGCFNDGAGPLARVAGQIPPEAVSKFAEAFQIGRDRSYRQDPRFGLVVLSEIASRALSPAVNDPGTAIAIIARGIALLSPWMQRQSADTPDREIIHRNVFIPPLETRDLLDDLFIPIARDGAALVEVQIALQKAYHSLATLGGGTCNDMLTRHAAEAMDRAMAALSSEADRERLRRHLYAAPQQT